MTRTTDPVVYVYRKWELAFSQFTICSTIFGPRVDQSLIERDRQRIGLTMEIDGALQELLRLWKTIEHVDGEAIVMSIQCDRHARYARAKVDAVVPDRFVKVAKFARLKFYRECLRGDHPDAADRVIAELSEHAATVAAAIITTWGRLLGRLFTLECFAAREYDKLLKRIGEPDFGVGSLGCPCAWCVRLRHCAETECGK